jgi:hypothetical protein
MKIHFRWYYGVDVTACGAEQQMSLECTVIRKKVTCKRCKNTKHFRKIK